MKIFRSYNIFLLSCLITVSLLANSSSLIAKDISQLKKNNVYLVAPLFDRQATVLLTGKENDITQPIAWTRTAGKSKVFYTSSGHPTDFNHNSLTGCL